MAQIILLRVQQTCISNFFNNKKHKKTIKVEFVVSIHLNYKLNLSKSKLLSFDLLFKNVPT